MGDSHVKFAEYFALNDHASPQLIGPLRVLFEGIMGPYTPRFEEGQVGRVLHVLTKLWRHQHSSDFEAFVLPVDGVYDGLVSEAT